MRNFLIALLIFLVWSVLALAIYSLIKYNETDAFIADIQNVFTPKDTAQARNKIINDTILSSEKITENKETITQPPKKEIPGLQAVGLDGDMVFNYDIGIEIFKNSNNLRIPTAIDSFKSKLKQYLTTNPDTEVHIISSYSAHENIERPNYGTQRGNVVKNILKENDIAENRLVVTPYIKDIHFDSLGKFDSGIRFIVQPFNEARANTINNNIPEKITVYPDFGQTGIKTNGSLEAALDVVNVELEYTPNINIKVIGHTDNVGNANDNYVTGLTYAREVRWYLITKAKIPASQITAVSEGESNPIDTNATESGRKLNRRIEIVFYK